MSRCFVTIMTLVLLLPAAVSSADLTAAEAERQRREAAGEELVGAPEPRPTSPSFERRQRALRQLVGAGLLLIPESTNDRVMAFDPTTGDLLDPDFIPSDPINLNTPINAVMHDDGTRVLVSDQVNDAIFSYDVATGVFLDLWAPAGGVNQTILDNARGFENNPFSTNYLATSGNTDSIPNFLSNGAYQFDCVSPGVDGLDSPFDENIWETLSVKLISAINSDLIHSFFDCDDPDVPFAQVDTFPQQIYIEEGVTDLFDPAVWVANFAGSDEGILVFDPDGTLLDLFNPPELTGYRGVYLLGNGNLLVTNGNGVHELSGTNGDFVESKITGVSARFIESTDLGFPTEIFADGFESGDLSSWSSSVP